MKQEVVKSPTVASRVEWRDFYEIGWPLCDSIGEARWLARKSAINARRERKRRYSMRRGGVGVDCTGFEMWGKDEFYAVPFRVKPAPWGKW